MKNFILFLICFSLAVHADTPPPGTVKAKMLSGDGQQEIQAVSGAIKVNISNTNPIPVSATVTVDPAGLATEAEQVVQSGYLQSIDSKLTSPLNVQFSGVQDVSGSVSVLNFPATQAVTGNFYQAVQPISGAVSVSNFPAVQDVSGSWLTNTQLRASPLSVDVPGGVDINNIVTVDTGLSQPLTDTQLRNSPVPVSVPAGVSVTNTVPVSGPLTNAQLRASPIEVSATITAILDPSGLATASNQTSQTSILSSIDSKLTSPLAVTGTFWQATQPVSLASIPLATNAATASKQDDQTTYLQSIESNTSSFYALTDTQLRASPVDVAVSGVMVTSATGTTPISAVSLPLPTLAATSTKQSDGSQKTQIVDGSGNVIGSTSNALDINIKSGSIANTSFIATQGTATNLKTQSEVYQGGVAVGSGAPLQVTLANTGSNSTAVKVDGSSVTQPISGSVSISGTPSVSTTGTIPVSIASTVAVSGPLTDAQLRASAVPVSSTGTVPITGSVSITGTPSVSVGTVVISPLTNSSVVKAQLQDNSGTAITVGQKAMSSSLPVVLASDQTAISVSSTGTVPVNFSNTSIAVTQSTATSLKSQAEVYQGGVAVGSGAPLQVTLANTGSNSTAVKVDGSAVTQPVSIAASVTVAQSTATNLKTQAENYQGGAAVGTANPLWVQVSGTGMAVTVTSGTIQANAGTNLNTSLLALESGGNLATIATRTPALGQATMTNSQPVVIASNQSSIPVSSTGVSSVLQNDIVVSGSITTQNLNSTGTATAGSALLSGSLSGYSTAMVGVSGTWSGSLVVQGTTDDAYWETLTGATTVTRMSTGVPSQTISSGQTGNFKILLSGYSQIRISSNSAQTGTAIVTMRISNGFPGQMAANYLPVNINQVGGGTIQQSNGTNTNAIRVAVASDNTPYAIKIDQTTPGTTNAVQLIGSSTSTGALSSASNSGSAYIPKISVKGSSGRLYLLTGYSANTSGQFIQIFNSASQPAANTAPTVMFYVPPSSNFSYDFGPVGRYFSTGIYVANSTSATGYVNGTSDTWINAEYQ